MFSYFSFFTEARSRLILAPYVFLLSFCGVCVAVIGLINWPLLCLALWKGPMEVPILSLGAAAALASLRAWQEHLPLPDSGEKKFHINANPIQAIHSFIHRHFPMLQ